METKFGGIGGNLKAPEVSKMMAVQNIRHFFMCYMQQSRNYVAKQNKILVRVNRNLEKRKDIFLKILDLINLQASLQELLPKRRTQRFRRIYRNNKNCWEMVSQTYSQKDLNNTHPGFPEQRLILYYQKYSIEFKKNMLLKSQFLPSKDLQFVHID